VVRAVAVAVVVAAVVALLATLRAAMERRRERAGPAAAITHAPAASPAPPQRDRREGRGEIERPRPAGGRAGALGAPWGWLAGSLSAGPVDPAWTSGELLRHVGRRELAPLALALDRLLYAAERPGPEHVRRFLAQGEEALP